MRRQTTIRQKRPLPKEARFPLLHGECSHRLESNNLLSPSRPDNSRIDRNLLPSHLLLLLQKVTSCAALSPPSKGRIISDPFSRGQYWRNRCKAQINEVQTTERRVGIHTRTTQRLQYLLERVQGCVFAEGDTLLAYLPWGVYGDLDKVVDWVIGAGCSERELPTV